MNRTYIKDIVPGTPCRVRGFIENIRNKRTMAFLVIRDVTGKLQLTIEKEKMPEIAAVVDTLSFFIFPTGYAYFPGYMLTEMLVSLTYGLFFYRRKITVAKLLCAKAITNFVWHVGLNALWSAILLNKGYLFYLWSSLTKNALLLVPEVLLMALFFGLMIPPFAKLGLLPAHSQKELQKLTLFKEKHHG